ncbi:nose resistant to fluoxetine protein 6-like [Battus philenor]|uniref:nose resistant to fluoxetine protein 6-like n=1 Tax=Battus philenor TaxID=42288 RepID=UPI0035CF114E
MLFPVAMCLTFAWSVDSVIYHLNETEYQRMPQLFKLDRHDVCLEDAGQYCMMRIQLLEGSNRPLMNTIKEYSAHTSKHYDHTYLEWGVCLTKTCKAFIGNRSLESTEDITEILGACLNSSIHMEYGLEAEVKQLYYCEKSGDGPEVGMAEWATACMLVVLLLLVAVGTLRYPSTSNSLGDKILENFSLYKNWSILVRLEVSDPTRKRLKGLHGVRSITIFLVMIIHVYFINTMGFTDNPHDVEKTYESIYFQLVYNGMLIVQIFLVMSAFLQAYHMHLYCEDNTLTWSKLPLYLLARWWRLTPACAALLAFTATWFSHLGSGPLWKMHVTDRPVSQCRSYWWYHLVYLNNYKTEDKWCAIQTWHTAADTQLQVVALVLLCATAARGRKIAIALMLLVGMILPALHVWWQDLNGVVVLSPELFRDMNDPTFGALHIKGHNYLACYAIGLATGSLVYRWHNTNVDLTKTKYKLGFLTWLLIPAIMCLFLSGKVFYADRPRVSLAVRVLYAVTLRAAFGFVIALMMISITMRFSESFNKVLEWNGWLVSSRLSYCLFLVHLNFVHALQGLRTQLSFVSSYYTLVLFLGVSVLSALMALPLYLLVEAPSNGLLAMFIQSKLKTKVVGIQKKQS